MRKIVFTLTIVCSIYAISFGQDDIDIMQQSNRTTEPVIDATALTDTIAEDETPDSVWAEISFDKTTHNYGSIPFEGDGSCEFTFKNIGNGQLILNNVKSTCGCTVPEWPKEPIKPGESAVIKVVYNTRRSGSFTKGITVYSNSTTGTMRLLIKGEVAPQKDKPVLGQ